MTATNDTDQAERRTEQRGRGRPEIGPMVNVRMPEDLIAWIDEQVERRDLGSRAEYVRELLQHARSAQTRAVRRGTKR